MRSCEVSWDLERSSEETLHWHWLAWSFWQSITILVHWQSPLVTAVTKTLPGHGSESCVYRLGLMRFLGEVLSGSAFWLSRHFSPVSFSASSSSVRHMSVFAFLLAKVVVHFYRRAWLSQQQLYSQRLSLSYFRMAGRIPTKFVLHWPVEPGVRVWNTLSFNSCLLFIIDSSLIIMANIGSLMHPTSGCPTRLQDDGGHCWQEPATVECQMLMQWVGLLASGQMAL